MVHDTDSQDQRGHKVEWDVATKRSLYKAAFTLEWFWTTTVQIDTVLTYRLHTNNENARQNNHFQIRCYRRIFAKTVPQFLRINSKMIVWLKRQHSSQCTPGFTWSTSHDCHALVLSHRF